MYTAAHQGVLQYCCSRDVPRMKTGRCSLSPPVPTAIAPIAVSHSRQCLPTVPTHLLKSLHFSFINRYLRNNHFLLFVIECHPFSSFIGRVPHDIGYGVVISRHHVCIRCFPA